MAPAVRFLHFGDQSADVNESLEKLYQVSKVRKHIASFLEKAFNLFNGALHDAGIYEAWMKGPGDFTTVLRSDTLHRDQIRVFVDPVLITVSQIGWAIVYLEQEADLRHATPAGVPVGTCLGALAGIATVFADDACHLSVIGAHVVGISTRVGLAVWHQTRSIDLEPGEWAAVVRGIDRFQAGLLIDDFNASRSIASHRRVYVSSSSGNRPVITISGPPLHLDAFLSHQPVSAYKNTKLRVYGPYHASHLPWPSVDELIGTSTFLDRELSNVDYAFFGSPHVSSLPRQNFGHMLKIAITQMLTETLDLDHAQRFVDEIAAKGPAIHYLIGPFNSHLLPRSVQEQPSLELRGLGNRFGQDIEFDDVQNENSIAIIGMAGKFPGAESPEELWKLLETGADMHRKIPIQRFDWETHCDPTGATRNTSLTPYACIYENADMFDLSLFKMSPREAAQTDPMHRLMLITAYEALESAGISETTTKGIGAYPSTGTYYGVSSDDWRQVNASQDIDKYLITGGIRAFGPGRISYHFGWQGPSLSVDTACSSSAVAINMACTALMTRDCKMALAGGANIMTASDLFAGLSRANFISPRGPCKTWDETADGYCRADAVATVVLKRLRDAQDDGDNILGVIRSISTNHAAEAISITHPHSATQEQLFRKVVFDAGLKPGDLDHIETHGTGTQAGDVAEVTSVANLVGYDRKNRAPLTLGAVKPNIGHSEAASGVTSLIKSLLMLRHGTVPPHVGIKGRINPQLPDLISRNLSINTKNQQFLPVSEHAPRRILVNNFNATGGSTALVLEEHIDLTPTVTEDPRGHYVFTISGATFYSLVDNVRRISHFIGTTDVNVENLSYTLSARRSHHAFRFACSASNRETAINCLEAFHAESIQRSPSLSIKSVVLVFTGQASSTTGMGRKLYMTHLQFRHMLQRLDRICVNMGFRSFLPIIEAKDGITPDTVSAQLALVALEISLADLLKTWGIVPVAAIGHSLGEYSALCVANVLSVTDTFYLVGKRATLFQQNLPSRQWGMLAISFGLDELLPELQRADCMQCELACLNGPESVVVAGPESQIDRLRVSLEHRKIRCIRLEVHYGYHSSQMDGILTSFGAFARQVAFRPPSIPIGSSVLGRVVEQGDITVFDAIYLTRHTREPVKFQAATMALSKVVQAANPTAYVECGPRPTCLPMVKATIRNTELLLVPMLQPQKDNWESISQAVGLLYEHGVDIRWNTYHAPFKSCLKMLQLPAYSFDLTSHWIQYEGDWCIRKNQPALNDSLKQRSGLAHLSEAVQYLSTSSLGSGMKRYEFRIRLDAPAFRKLAFGQKLLGHAICPLAVYVYVAYIVAKYVTDSVSIESFGIEGLELQSPLLLDVADANERHLRMTVSRSSQHKTLDILFTEVHNKLSKQRARCAVIIQDDASHYNLPQQASLYQSRVEEMSRRADSKQHCSLTQAMAYRCLRNNMKYDYSMETVDEIIMDNTGLEATALVNLPEGTDHEEHALRPIVLDSTSHLATLAANMSEKAKHDTVFVCDTWRRVRLLENLDTQTQYRAYVNFHIADKDNTTLTGDICIFAGERVVGMVEGVSYRACTQVQFIANLGSDALNGYEPSTSQSGMSEDKDRRHSGLPPLETEDSVVAPSWSRNIMPAVDDTLPAPANNVERLPVLIQEKPPLLSAELLRSIIAEELGIPSSMVDDVTPLADLGMDSIMGIAVEARVKKETGRQIPTHVFHKCGNMPEVRAYLACFPLDGSRNLSRTMP